MADFIVTDGPLGTEAMHRWTAGNGATLPWDLNDLAAFPQVKVRKIQGLGSLPEVDTNVDQPSTRMGEIPRAVYSRGKTLVYDLEIRADGLRGLRQMDFALKRAFSERSLLGRMEGIPHPNFDPGDHYYYDARVTAFDGDEDWSDASKLRHPRGPWIVGRTLALRLLDPRAYWTALQATGGKADGATHVCTNLGNAPTDPIFTIAVALGDDIVLTNADIVTPAGPVALTFADMPAAGSLVVDMKERTALLDGDDVSGHFVSASSTWWDELVASMRVGTNGITVTGGAWSATWRHAAWA